MASPRHDLYSKTSVSLCPNRLVQATFSQALDRSSLSLLPMISDHTVQHLASALFYQPQ